MNIWFLPICKSWKLQKIMKTKPYVIHKLKNVGKNWKEKYFYFLLP